MRYFDSGDEESGRGTGEMKKEISYE